MSINIKSMIITLFVIAFITSGCKHNEPFPGLEGEGELVADDSNAAYDDSIQENTKAVSPKVVASSEKIKKETKKTANAQKTAKKVEKVSAPEEDSIKKEKEVIVKTGAKAELSVPNFQDEPQKDLSKPDPVVEDTAEEVGAEYIITERAPAVITDMDLTEMDGKEVKTTVIEPVSKTTTVISTKEVIKEENSVSQNPSVFYLAETVYFSNGGASVDSSYYKKLRSVVREAKKHNGKIIVQGFASSRTKNTDVITHKMANLKVSIARAENVAKLLNQFGMQKSRIVTEGLSDSRPAYQEVMPEGERLNRRAEIYISY